ncbi:hypothetical protein N7488_011265 [Penicillium malachiteum]|nr:hypothetical protein N7488_011265 [Penicillium malachiteum]
MDPAEPHQFDTPGTSAPPQIGVPGFANKDWGMTLPAPKSADFNPVVSHLSPFVSLSLPTVLSHWKHSKDITARIKTDTPVPNEEWFQSVFYFKTP